MLPAQSFHFIRHGQTDWNVHKRVQGRSDIPLNATGLAQARSAVPLVTGLDLTHIVSSPLQRAKRTAEILNESLQLPLLLDDNLQERHYGSFEGRIVTEILDEHNLPHTVNFNTVPPLDGESWDTLKQRATKVIKHWLTELAGAKVLFVSHGGFAIALGEVLLDQQHLDLPNAQPVVFHAHTSGWHVATLNPSTAA